MTPVFCCGMECGVTGGHITLSGSASFVTASPLSGLRSVRFNTSASQAAITTVGTFGAGLQVARVRIKFTTLPNADCIIISNSQAGTTTGSIFKSADSKIYAQSAGTAGATGIAVTTGVEYIIDTRINTTTAGAWAIDVRVNDVACGQATSNSSANVLAAAIVLGPQANVTTDFLVDDLLVSVTTGDYPLGAGKVLSFVPNADGTHTSTGTNIVKGTIAAPTGGGAITSGTTDAFNRVNARPILGGVSDNTFLINHQTNASTEYCEVAFEDTVEVNPPRAVEILTADREAATTTGNFATKLNDNGTESDIVNRGTVAGVTTDRYATKQFATMVGGGAWTLARFNGLKARFGYSSDATPDQYWRGIMIEAEFPESLAAEGYGTPFGEGGQRLMTQLLAQ